MKTSPASDADTLRLTRCDDPVTGERQYEPIVMNPDIVNPTNIFSGRIRSIHDRVLRPTRQQCEGRRAARRACEFRPDRFASDRTVMVGRETDSCKVEAVPASSGQILTCNPRKGSCNGPECRTVPSVAGSCLSKHRPRWS